MVLVVDRQPERGEAFAAALRREGLPQVESRTGLADEPFAVAVVRLDGPEDLALVADAHRRGRVLALAPEPMRIAAFEAGADDVTGADPLSIREVTLRIRGLRRSAPVAPSPSLPPPPPPSPLRAADRSLRVRGDWLPLSGVEFALVSALAERPGRAWTRDELLERVWGAHAGLRTVDSTVKRLRARLGPARDAIETVRGRGYRWDPSRLEV
jgi:DNA-binding response OmpR family regulator